MKTERLLKLADFLDTVPNSRFNIWSWTSHASGEGDTSTAVKALGVARHHCGTTACAVGWACTIPEFKAAGLGFSAEKWGDIPVYHDPDGIAAPKFYWTAVTEFFGLDAGTATSLFTDEGYSVDDPTPADVAAKIHRVVDKYLASFLPEVAPKGDQS
jgi:hypothetical protein